jgi:hypothetical protein
MVYITANVAATEVTYVIIWVDKCHLEHILSDP